MAEDPSVVYFQCCRIGTVPKLGMYMHACFVALWAKTSDTLCVMWPCFTFQRACLANSVFVNLKEKKSFTFFSAKKLPCCCYLCVYVCVCVCVCVCFTTLPAVSKTSCNTIRQEQSGAHPSCRASSTFGER